jgi:hypothetical protein
MKKMIIEFGWTLTHWIKVKPVFLPMEIVCCAKHVSKSQCHFAAHQENPSKRVVECRVSNGQNKTAESSEMYLICPV